MPSFRDVPHTGRGPVVAALSLVAVVTGLATAIASPGAARDAFVAGQRGTTSMTLGATETRVVLTRAVSVGHALGLPAGARREAIRLRDRFEGGVVDEVTTFDGAGRPVAIQRFAPDGSIRVAVRLGWSDATGDLRPSTATGRARAFATAAGLAVGQPTDVRRDPSGRGWRVQWQRTIDAVPVRGDGTWIRLWPDGSLHSLSRIESPADPPPAERIPAGAARRIVAERLATWQMTDASVASPVLAWIAPNDLLEPRAGDAVDVPRRLAWVVRATPAAGQDTIRAVELYVDAGDGRLLGGDVLE